MINSTINFLKFSFGSFIFLSFINKTCLSIKKTTETESMSPSFNPNLQGKINKCNLLKKNKDQLTYMHHPMKHNTEVVRYITALPGQWIKDKHNEIYHRIPQGHCWVESLNGTDDSSTWGPVPLSILIGKPVLKIRFFKKLVGAKKIEKNMRRKLNINERVLDNDKINSFFI